MPKVDRSQLPNGLVLYLIEDHSLPKVQGFLLVKTGARLEPGEKVGLASIVGQVMRTGGTTTRKGEEIDRLLENVGASVETGIGTNSATASLFTLKETLPQVLEILADVVRNPAFPKDKIKLAKVQERSGIARRNDDVGTIATREFFKTLYSERSPYARTTEYATIENISQGDLVAFHRRYFQPNQALLGLWGDFDTAEVKALVERLFGSWPRGEGKLPPLPQVPSDWRGSVNFIQKDDVNQTNLRIGHLGGRLDDPDYYALDVMAEILGGGLSSRLFRRVRSELGLAYACFGAWNPSFDHTGFFVVRCDTKSESTVRAAQEVIKEIRRIAREAVAPDELRTAKEGILNSFVFNFDTTAEIVRRLMTYEYYGYPSDFLQRFKANIEKVTAEDVLRAARKHLQPDKLVILAVGRQQDFDQPLATLGEVSTIDITIPAPQAAAAAVPEATPESLARGQEVVQAAIEGMGGLEVLKGIRDETVLMKIQQVTPQGELPLTSKAFIVWPDKFRQDVVLPFGEVSLVFDGERAWQETPRGVQDLPPAQVEELRKTIARSLEILLLEAHEGKRTVQFLESASVNGSKADVILVTDQTGEAVKLYVGKNTGYTLKKINPGRSPFSGPVEEEQIYSDFRSVGGLTVPFKILTLHNGKKAREGSVQSYEVNVGVDPSLFARKEEAK
ncbi:MAG: M16 family metallopeptidase [Terriglobia bacterium]